MVRDLRESRSRIEYLQRISAWQEFARRLAHEIKNPLTPIQLAVQEVQRSYPGGDELYAKKLTEATAIVEEEIATLRRLVGEFSSFARLPQASLAPADLNDFVRDAARTAEFGEREPREGDEISPDIAIKLDLSDQPINVRIDAMMLKRCLDNLVRNARQAIESVPIESDATQNSQINVANSQPVITFRASSFSPSDDSDVTNKKARVKRGIIRIRTAREREKALLEVDDNGVGIIPSNRKFVFDPYFTTKKEGTGLGLAIVKKVVLEHGGDIECINSDLGGASFRIKLPIFLNK
jgi:nitrogen fixation/metabolism regulation signal transduction histidine kinase